MAERNQPSDAVPGRADRRRDYLLWILLAALVALLGLATRNIVLLPGFVDWRTIATLAGLMVLAAAMEASGALQHIARSLLTGRMSERQLALVMVGTSAAIAMVLTNDMALFVLVPFTLAAGRWAALPLRRLVIFEALAVNAGSLLTPIGNPQNIVLWQASGVSFDRFSVHMALPFGMAMLLLLGLTALAFSKRRITVDPDRFGPLPIDKPLLATAALLFAPFVVLVNFHYNFAALGLVVGVFIVAFPRRLRVVDWSLLVIFVLMFADLGLIAQYHFLRHLNLSDPDVLYLTGALLSQGLSNVPATILLVHHSGNWKVIAWAVNVGGFGLVIGSLANLIALRLGQQRGSYLAFHAWSIPYFCVVGALIWLFV